MDDFTRPAPSARKSPGVDEDPDNYLSSLASTLSASMNVGMSRAIDGAKAVFAEVREKLYPDRSPHPHDFEWLAPAIEQRMRERGRALGLRDGLGLRPTGAEIGCSHTVIQRALAGAATTLPDYYKIIRWLDRTGGIDTGLQPEPRHLRKPKRKKPSPK